MRRRSRSGRGVIVVASVLLSLGWSAAAADLSGLWAVTFFPSNGAERVLVMAEPALTPEEQRRGLQGRERLAGGDGMIFVRESVSIARFWMKDTLIPLDMIFVTEDLQVLAIRENVPPCPPRTACPIYSSSGPVKYVVEVDAGFSARHGIGEGDRVAIERPSH